MKILTRIRDLYFLFNQTFIIKTMFVILIKLRQYSINLKYFWWNTHFLNACFKMEILTVKLWNFSHQYWCNIRKHKEPDVVVIFHVNIANVGQNIANIGQDLKKKNLNIRMTLFCLHGSAAQSKSHSSSPLNIFDHRNW